MNFARALLRTAAVSVAGFAVGCASPGPPHPPSLHLPAVVKDLTAQRTGDAVELHWTTPDKTTDHVDVKNAMTAEICRVSPAAAKSCVSVRRVAVQPGASEAEDDLPSELSAGRARLIGYRIQIYNWHGRSAGLSDETLAAAGAAPAPVQGLRASSARTGAMLEWEPRESTGYVVLDRRLRDAEPPAARNAKSKERPGETKAAAKAAAKPAAKPAETTHRQPGEARPATYEVKLRTPDGARDAGGTLDETAQNGVAYLYTAQRVEKMTLEGHALEMRSLISAPVALEVRDTFPPQVPTGLEAVQGGTRRSIDLSWEPSPDADVAGYNVYRRAEPGTGAAVRLNAAPVEGPAYSDATVQPGQGYAYRVTAVDRVGNESAPSVEVHEAFTQR